MTEDDRLTKEYWDEMAVGRMDEEYNKRYVPTRHQRRIYKKYHKEENMARYTYAENTLQVKFGDTVLSGNVTSLDVTTNYPTYNATGFGETSNYIRGAPETTITATIYGDFGEALDMSNYRWNGKTEKMYTKMWEAIREHIDSGSDDCINLMHIGKNGRYRISIEKISDEEVAMKAVYKVYAVNRETGVVWQGSEPFSGDKRRDVALQAAILNNAPEIRELGASELVHVWLEPVGDYEEI